MQHITCLRGIIGDGTVGQILQVHLNDGEPRENVPRSVAEEGHEVLRIVDNGDGTFELYIKKVGD